MLIDFHTHCFPDKLAERAVAQLAHAAGGIMNYTNGTIGDLKAKMNNEAVNASVVLNIATNEHQTESVNNFAASINDNNTIFAFGSVYPRAKNVLEELDRIKSLGLRGVKFHPEYQKFYVDDEMMKPIYKKISQLGLITVFHAGKDYGFMPPYHCMPKNMKNALKWFDAPVVAAHWGAMNCAEEVLEELCGLDIYFDSSFGYSQISRIAAEKILERHGIDKLLFGTDSPWHTPSIELRLINSLGLSDNEKNAVCFENAAKLLNIIK